MMLLVALALLPTTVTCPQCGWVHPEWRGAMPITRVRQVIAAAGAEGVEAEAVRRLIWRESKYDPTMQNPLSTSSTLNGFLDATWEDTGISKTDCTRCQVVAMLRYIDARYGTAVDALDFHRRNGWY